MNETTNIHAAYRAHWGAIAMPFQDLPQELYLSDPLQRVNNKMTRYIELGLSGLLSGANGVGKSALLHHVLAQLPEQQYAVIQLSHSTITGSDMIRRLCGLNGLPASIRRSENIQRLIEFWHIDGRKPVLVFDEAQLLDPATLEEIRLLNCERIHNSGPTQSPPFVTLLCGDDDLLHMIQLNTHRALRSRLSFSLQVQPFDASQTRAYVQARWQQVGVHDNPFDDQALHTLFQASEGVPRSINHIARHAVLEAIDESCPTITAIHVQTAIDEMPWLPTF